MFLEYGIILFFCKTVICSLENVDYVPPPCDPPPVRYAESTAQVISVKIPRNELSCVWTIHSPGDCLKIWYPQDVQGSTIVYTDSFRHVFRQMKNLTICTDILEVYYHHNDSYQVSRGSEVNIWYHKVAGTRLQEYHVHRREDVPITVEARSTSIPKGTNQNNDSGGPNVAVIVVAVLIPLLLIAVGGCVAYVWYRRKYPVRMIIGKDFGRFSNPAYDKRKSTATLVRENATLEDAFARDIEKGAALTGVPQDNLGFDADDDPDYQPIPNMSNSMHKFSNYRRSFEDSPELERRQESSADKPISSMRGSSAPSLVKNEETARDIITSSSISKLDVTTSTKSLTERSRESQTEFSQTSTENNIVHDKTLEEVSASRHSSISMHSVDNSNENTNNHNNVYENYTANDGNLVGENDYQNLPNKSINASTGNVPSSAENVPASSERDPSIGGNVPSSVENIPASVESVPFVDRNVLSSAENVPASTESIPSIGGNVPSSAENVLASAENVPSKMITTSENAAYQVNDRREKDVEDKLITNDENEGVTSALEPSTEEAMNKTIDEIELYSEEGDKTHKSDNVEDVQSTVNLSISGASEKSHSREELATEKEDNSRKYNQFENSQSTFDVYTEDANKDTLVEKDELLAEAEDEVPESKEFNGNNVKYVMKHQVSIGIEETETNMQHIDYATFQQTSENAACDANTTLDESFEIINQETFTEKQTQSEYMNFSVNGCESRLESPTFRNVTSDKEFIDSTIDSSPEQSTPNDSDIAHVTNAQTLDTIPFDNSMPQSGHPLPSSFDKTNTSNDNNGNLTSNAKDSLVNLDSSNDADNSLDKQTSVNEIDFSADLNSDKSFDLDVENLNVSISTISDPDIKSLDSGFSLLSQDLKSANISSESFEILSSEQSKSSEQFLEEEVIPSVIPVNQLIHTEDNINHTELHGSTKKVIKSDIPSFDDTDIEENPGTSAIEKNYMQYKEPKEEDGSNSEEFLRKSATRKIGLGKTDISFDETDSSNSSSKSEIKDISEDELETIADIKPPLKRRESVTLDNPAFNSPVVSVNLEFTTDENSAITHGQNRRKSITVDNPFFNNQSDPLSESVENTMLDSFSVVEGTNLTDENTDCSDKSEQDNVTDQRRIVKVNVTFDNDDDDTDDDNEIDSDTVVVETTVPVDPN